MQTVNYSLTLGIGKQNNVYIVKLIYKYKSIKSLTHKFFLNSKVT